MSSEESNDSFGAEEITASEIYRELRRIAAQRMISQPLGQTLQATALAHEAWLKLSKSHKEWKNRQHFFATASKAMRHILIDNARRKSRLRHGGDYWRVDPAILDKVASPEPDDLILLIDEGITQLERINPIRSQIVIAKFFVGLNDAEIANDLGVSERTVERHWVSAKVWLLRWVKSGTVE